MEDNETKIISTNPESEVQIGSDSRLGIIRVGETKVLQSSVPSNAEQPVKWVWIATDFLDEAKQIAPGQSYRRWGEWTKHRINGPVDTYGIGKQYTMTDRIQVTGKPYRLAEGTIVYFETFVDMPTLNRGYYLATVDEPKLMRAAFAAHKDAFMYPGEGASNIYTYKSTVRLYIQTHLIPDYTVGYHNFALFEVDIYDCNRDEKITNTPLYFYQKTRPGKFSVNTVTELDITIDEAWRDASGHTPGKTQAYYAKIKTTLFHNEDAKAASEAEPVDTGKILSAHADQNPAWFRNTFGAVAPNGESVTVQFNSKDEAKWFGIFRDSEQGKTNAARYSKRTLETYNTIDPGVALEGQLPFFKVRWNTMDVILEHYEAAKSNMLAVVGDVEYTQKSGEPCKYSALEVSAPGRKPVTVFNEDETTVTDKTDQVFGIVAGAQKKTVTITANGLAIQDYQAEGLDKPRCLGITASNTLPGERITPADCMSLPPQPERTSHAGEEEFIHQSIKDVFPMQQVHAIDPLSMVSAMQQGTGHGDTLLDITAQQLDHEYKKNYIKLELGYVYNKTYDTRAEQWLGNKFGEFTNDLVDIAWIVRYFYLRDDFKQTYLVPATTCRYPNQVVKVEVCPDVEWWVNVNYNAKNPAYVRQTPNYGYRVIIPDKHKNRRNALKYARDRKAMKNGEYELEYEAGFKYNGETIEFNSGDGFPVINAINFLLKAYEIFKAITFADETQTKKQPVANGTAQSSKGALAKKMTERYRQRKSKGFPFRMDVSRPSFSGGVYGSYQQSKNQTGAMGAMYEVVMAANPLFGIEGKVDLLFFAQFIGPIGVALEKINRVVKRVDYLTLGAVKIDYYLYLAAKADLDIEVSGLNHHSLDGWSGGEVNARLPIKIWLESGVNVNVNLQGVASADAEAVIRGEANMDLQITLDKRANKCPLEFTFNGLDIKIWVSFNARSNSRSEKKGNSSSRDSDSNEPPEQPNRKPDAVKNLLKPGKPYKVNIL